MSVTIAITSEQELDAALAVLGDLDATVAKANADLDQALSLVRDQYANRFTQKMPESGDMVPIAELREQLVGHIKHYCEKHRKQLLVEDKKSVELNHGKVGWRKQPDSIELLKLDEETKGKTLLAKCKQALLSALGLLTLKLGKLAFAEYVNVKVEYRKDHVLKALDDKQVTTAALLKQGIVVHRGSDEFYCEPKSEKRAT